MKHEDLPTLLLVHGAWHRKEMWSLLIDELPDIDIRTVQLPSSAPVPTEQLGDLYDDAAAVKAAAEAVDGPVVVVVHSYGGAPVTQGLVDVRNVRRVVYLSAWQLDVGESILGFVGGQPLDWMKENPEAGYYDMMSPRDIFYSDLSEEDADKAAAALGPQSVASLQQTLTQAVWRTSTPTTHIYGEKDPFADVYRSLAKRAGKVRTLPSAHSSFLSHPVELAQMLREELREAASGRTA